MSDSVYIDIPIDGANQSGTFITDNDALENAVKLWLLKGRGEDLRRITGGWVLKHLGKPMDDDRALSIASDIQKGLRSEFKPELTIKNLSVVPNYSQRRWEIHLIAFSPELQVGVANTFFVGNG